MKIISWGIVLTIAMGLLNLCASASIPTWVVLAPMFLSLSAVIVTIVASMIAIWWAEH